MTDHKQTARDIIDRMKGARPTCDRCEWQAFTASLSEPNGPEGFELMPHFAGYVKRCETCATSRKFPWSDKLDVERVAHMLEHDARCRGVFELAILEETLQPYTIVPGSPFRFPVHVGIENGQITEQLVGSTDMCGKHLVNAEVCGCEPMPLVFTQKRKGFEFL